MYETYDFAPLVAPVMEWYQIHKRDLPWRQTKNPYAIWVSEIMLQQTRVEAVKPYYTRFLENLPDVEALSRCEQQRLLKLWEGLGYYSRVRNMQKAAQKICEVYHGVFPQTYKELLSLPGIGNYTAGAISSIAFDKPEPAVDGNVLRILSRVSLDDSDILKEQTKKRARSVLLPIMPKKPGEPGAFNQALMELGATVCVPGGLPHCKMCPWNHCCLAKQTGRIEELPVRKSNKVKRIEKRTILLVVDGQKIFIRQRPSSGLLAGLYEFINEPGHLTKKEALKKVEEQGLLPLYIEPLPKATHVFSHVEWHMHGYLVRVAMADSFEDSILIDIEDVQRQYPIPSAFRAYATYLGIEKTFS